MLEIGQNAGLTPMTLCRRCSVHAARSRERSHPPGAAITDVPRPEAGYDAERICFRRTPQAVQRHDDQVERPSEATARARQTSLPRLRQVRCRVVYLWAML